MMLVVCGFAPVRLAAEALEQPSARQDGWMGIITGSQYRCSVDTCSGRRGSGRSLTPSPRLVRVPSGVIRSRSTAWLPRKNFGRDPTVDDLSSIKLDQARSRSIKVDPARRGGNFPRSLVLSCIDLLHRE